MKSKILNSYTQSPEFVQSYIDTTIQAEGGYVDNVDDSGGETNYGITYQTAMDFGYEWKHYNWNGDINSMPLAFAQDVYAYDYYYRPKIDLVADVSKLLAKELFDTGVNTGSRTPIKWMQRLLNVFNNKGEYYPDIEVDGYLGSATINAYKGLCAKRGDSAAEKVLYNGLNSMQAVHYIELAESREKDETFVYGQLLHRVDWVPF